MGANRKVDVGPRRRSEKNKNLKQGAKNRAYGIFKKADTMTRLYGGDAIVIVQIEGSVTCFQSHEGLLQQSVIEKILAGPDVLVQGPSDFETSPPNVKNKRWIPRRSTSSSPDLSSNPCDSSDSPEPSTLLGSSISTETQPVVMTAVETEDRCQTSSPQSTESLFGGSTSPCKSNVSVNGVDNLDEKPSINLCSSSGSARRSGVRRPRRVSSMKREEIRQILSSWEQI